MRFSITKLEKRVEMKVLSIKKILRQLSLFIGVSAIVACLGFFWIFIISDYEPGKVVNVEVTQLNDIYPFHLKYPSVKTY